MGYRRSASRRVQHRRRLQYCPPDTAQHLDLSQALDLVSMQILWRQMGHQKIVPFVTGLAIVLAGAEYGLVYALRLARERGQIWPSILMAIVVAILLAGGVLRHYVQMLRTRSDARVSLKFATLDLSGDVASLLSVIFQKTLKIYGLVIYGSELAIWIGLIGLALYYRQVGQGEPSKTTGADPVVEDRQHSDYRPEQSASDWVELYRGNTRDSWLG